LILGKKPCFLGPSQLARQKVNIHYLEWSFFDGMSCVSATLSHSRQDTSKGMVKVPKAVDKGLRYKADTIDNVGHG
jgi:hypothetical protein